MGKIILKNIRTFSYHGCLVEESKIGSNYRVDLEVKTNLRHSAITDDLNDTVDYVALNQIVVQQMAIRENLLETVAHKIIRRAMTELSAVKKIKVVVTKLNPPIGGDVEGVSIVLKKSRKKFEL
jgi:7,8-dihydroneopterin aldolase/epimerase/oxygenase